MIIQRYGAGFLQFRKTAVEGEQEVTFCSDIDNAEIFSEKEVARLLAVLRHGNCRDFGVVSADELIEKYKQEIEDLENRLTKGSIVHFETERTRISINIEEATKVLNRHEQEMEKLKRNCTAEHEAIVSINDRRHFLEKKIRKIRGEYGWEGDK